MVLLVSGSQSGVQQASVLGPLLSIIYTSEMFELVENRLYTYMPLLMTHHYWQLFTSQQTDLLLLPLLTCRDLATVQEWCNHWHMIVNPNKTKALVVSRSGTVNPLHGDLVLSGVSICDSPNLEIFLLKFDSPLTSKTPERYYLS